MLEFCSLSNIADLLCQDHTPKKNHATYSEFDDELERGSDISAVQQMSSEMYQSQYTENRESQKFPILASETKDQMSLFEREDGESDEDTSQPLDILQDMYEQ